MKCYVIGFEKNFYRVYLLALCPFWGCVGLTDFCNLGSVGYEFLNIVVTSFAFTCRADGIAKNNMWYMFQGAVEKVL